MAGRFLKRGGLVEIAHVRGSFLGNYSACASGG